MSETDYSDYSKAELQARADELEVAYDDSDTKAELIASIEDAEAGADETATADDAAAGDAPPAPDDAASGPFPSEQFPQLAPIEPDLANVPTDEHEGEHQAPLNAESWVILDGASDQVPDRFDGHLAAVLSWPTSVEHDTDTGETITYTSPDGWYTVQERSQGAILSVQADAFKSVHTGRPEAVGFA